MSSASTSTSTSSLSSSQSRKSPPTFQSLLELHPLILSYLKSISPLTLLPLSKELYEELLPQIYSSITLNRSNARKLFIGYTPLTPSWAYRNKRSRYLHDQPLHGRRSRSSPPDVASPTAPSADTSRKSHALSLTRKVVLEDAESLSIICEVHRELLSYSPVQGSIELGRRRTIDHSDTSSPEDGGIPWPLSKVEVLEVGSELIEYLVDCHAPAENRGRGRERLPICCIPFQPQSLIVHLPQLGGESAGTGRKYLRQAIAELAGEFELDKLVLRIHVPLRSSTREGNLAESDEGEIYIPPVESPLPARRMVIILEPKIHPGTSKGEALYEDDQRYSIATVNFLEDTGRRTLNLPDIQIVLPSKLRSSTEREVRQRLDGDGFGGYPQSVGKRVLDKTVFTDLQTAKREF
ncbi:hypothetical protein I302_100069 [Kwoniella bestiolae CBS 10118]|uniref:Uncharacterized protein n=1 Tax=Kwoniella bestiolae CBS 10118 TaxID=1296100 RepID=A0A1B9G452_9TREE|nr:hypothetical protein I302_03441 [Kwoniella bestiolae CBS 10118]OCF25768.1 hypothetical protein I302_03441 [Kwoniella bestiolae CBS 10118]